MTYRMTTLGRFVAELMAKQQLTNRSLAALAGISEGAVRNLLKFGNDANAKDPDARTLRQVADALGVNPLRLFRLAGYLPPQPDSNSVRAEYIADLFDALEIDKQDAVLGVLEAMTKRSEAREVVQEMRRDPRNALAGLDIAFPGVLRVIANDLIVRYELREPTEVERIEPNAEVLQNPWTKLPLEMRNRIKALIRHKLSLNYDPTMVEDEWRD